ncbi:MAG: hypothetical protein BYD32DRAFT_409529 [Podila humilis]|nr:MAG: hypothetical protein BYD32DRAFT_409529 [Podila humilis]
MDAIHTKANAVPNANRSYGTRNDSPTPNTPNNAHEQTPLLHSDDSASHPYSIPIDNNDNSNVNERQRSLDPGGDPTPDRSKWDHYLSSVKAVALLLVGCVLVVVLSPLAAQRVLDRALVIDIQKTDIHKMDDTGFQISIESTLYLDSSNDGFFGLTRLVESFHPIMTIDPTVLSLGIPSLDNVQMAEFPMERQQMPMGQQLPLKVSAHVLVTNSTLMAEFFSSTLNSSTVQLSIRGALWTRLGRLWYMKLRLNRMVPLDGLKGIQNATLVSMALPGDHPQGGIIMSGVARINNPSSVVSMGMGSVTFGVYLPSNTHPEVDQYQIAEMQCSQLRLEAGQSNNIELSGRLFHLDDWTRIEIRGASIAHEGSEKQLLLGQLLSRFIQGDNSTIQVRALSKDPSLPPWLSQVFKGIVLDMIFPGAPTKDFIRALDLEQLQFGFTDDKDSALLSGRLSSTLQLPPNVTFPIKVLKMKPVARLHPPGQPNMALLDISDFLTTTSHQDHTTLQVRVDLEDTPLRILEDRLSDFYQFLNSSFSQDWIELGIAGDALAMVETGLGTFELGPIPFDVVTRQKGLGGLISTPPLLESLDVVDSTEHSLTVKVTLVLWNPSNISASLGDLSFLWSFDGYEIGMATSPELTLGVGNNTIEAYGMMNPSLHCDRRQYDPLCDPEEAIRAAREFISRYISGDNTTSIKVLGYPESTHIPLLQPMMESFSIESSLPELDQEFLISATMYLLSSSLIMELKNPLDTIITVLYINGTASYKDEPLGHILIDFEKDMASPKPILSLKPILIPANDHQNETSGYVKTPRLPVMFDLSSVGYEALKKALGGSLEVDVLCHIKAKVGSMVTWVDFVKDGVVANVRKGF